MTDETLSMLASSAEAFAKPDAKRVRRLRDSETGFDLELWKSIADQGWLSILVPESLEGLGLGMAAAAVIARRLGYALYPEPYVASGIMATRCLASGDGETLQRRVLPELMAGEKIAAVAWQGESGDLDIGACGVTASPSGDGAILTGTCRFVPVAFADAFMVAARGADGLSLYWVERGATGLACTPERCADGSKSARLTFSKLRVRQSARIAGPARAQASLAQAIDAALVGTGAELVGIMDRALELTLDYLRTRKQFGRAIGSFQALQHRAVDIWIQKELARAAVGAAVRALDDPKADARSQAAAACGAKARAAQAALALCKEALQMHGAIGYTDEYDLGLYFNRALTLSAWLGNAADQRRRYGELAGEAAA